MSAALEQIEREALTLPVRDRAERVDNPGECLGGATIPVMGDKRWAAMERRRQELLHRKVNPIPGAAVSHSASEAASSTRS